jgi:WD40 repeat protein
MVVHPSKMIVATGEADSNPLIHIWDIYTCSTIKVIKTYHLAGIINIEFSNDGSFLYSIGNDK